MRAGASGASAVVARLRGDERLARLERQRTNKGPVVVAPDHSELAIVVEIRSRDALVRLRVWDERVDPRSSTRTFASWRSARAPEITGGSCFRARCASKLI